MKKSISRLLKLVVGIALISSCTKQRKAELADEQKSSIFAISEFGAISDSSPFALSITGAAQESADNSPLAMNPDSQAQTHSFEAKVPERMKFMFENMPLMNLSARNFQVLFAVDREFVTGYKMTDDLSTLTPLEKVLATTAKELKVASDSAKAAPGQMKDLEKLSASARIEKENIISGNQKGMVLVPLFKYKVLGYGTLAKAKNELKEDTARLELKSTEWKAATHIQISAKTDDRQMVAFGIEQTKQLKQIFAENKIDNQTMTADQLQSTFKVGMKFVDPTANVFTRLDAGVMHIYEISTVQKLNDTQRRLLKGDNSTRELISCADASVSAYISKKDADCVLILKADIPISYKRAKLSQMDGGATTTRVEFEEVNRSNSTGLVEIQENATAKQVDLSGALDPNSSIKISDIQGEFYYRRTFEAASNMFLGRTGTSGDMTIVKFELEDKRIVVRNQQALINYTGQGAMDREELMSFPVRYIRLVTTDANGIKLSIPQVEQTTKDKAEYAVVDWTNNTVPDAVSPLAFYAGGDCFMATSSLNVSDADMRLANDGVLNYSLSGSYTVKPNKECVATKDVNSAYWSGSSQFNFNVKERISFLKRKDASDDKQFAENISSMAQAAFNFGVFTLADNVTDNGTMLNRDGYEKYMPVIHDFRDGKIVTYHLGGINNSAATPADRRTLLVEAAQQVITEWNATLKLAFKGTSLQRDGDYVKLVIDDSNTEAHLGDLDRNYIWFQELPAENGLLGVAQPAANPRSGTIKSANVIIYTGNTYDQTEKLLKVSRISREYERNVEKIKSEIIAQVKAQREQQAPDSKSAPPTSAPQSLRQNMMPFFKKVNGMLEQSVAALDLDNKRVQNALFGMSSMPVQKTVKRILNKETLRAVTKGQVINYEVNQETFMKKITELAVTKRAANNPYEFEIALNDAFIQFGDISEQAKASLQKRSELLTAAIRFDRNTRNRPGCYEYTRTDINDMAEQMDEDPVKNLQLNFKKNVMSTLSHELGHAFGLLHNFKASADKENFEFPNEKTGRNYSSIMDYIADIDMHYAGPGPYDAHAIRAAYTGLVELSEKAKGKIPATDDNLAKISDITKALGMNSYVHLTKDTVNKLNVIKYYEQCDDGGVGDSALCARFDVGGTATEIVQNYIQDYNRGYINRNYVYDKILFDAPQKIQIINRNISTFQSIRSFLDEALMSNAMPPGLPQEKLQSLMLDEINAAKIGYQFFHELIRTPGAASPEVLRPVVKEVATEAEDAKEINAQAAKDKENDSNHDGLVANEKRFAVLPFKYKDADGKEQEDFKVIEKRALFDVQMNSDLTDIEDQATQGDRGKIDTIGISYDKAFAMMFLLQSTAAQTKDDTIQSNISYMDFEQQVLGISNPTESPIMNTILEILSMNLKVGFFAPTSAPDQVDFREVNGAVQVNRMLSERTAVGTIIGLAQSKWQNFDAFAEMFKVAKSSESAAPNDRFNAIKAGQTRGLSDTKVYYAPQNAVGATVLINSASRNEWYLNNREILFKSIQVLFDADQIYTQAIAKIKEEACAEDAKSDKCQAARAKKIDQYLAENPEMAAAKAAADEKAAAFVQQLRDLNTDGHVIRKDMDDVKSPTNLSRQVEVLRSITISQVDLLRRVKVMLESVPNDEKQLQAAADQINQQLAKLRANNNQKLESIQLLATGFAFVANSLKEEKVELKNGEKIPLVALARILMNTRKIQNDLDQQQSVIEKLSKYSTLVDPDLISR